ncbi:prepilin-type N-terminal cleavage/methylation domain-containing protein [Paenibacillus sp. BR2-3]|uniref:type II secretion system protein n=1 Tax=Paenibacillus sp. BR2-3 TaxID=3048494 RepID=UPI00397761C7
MLAQALKKRLSKEENQKGFTLIELLAVIVILGIISVIAVPMITNIISKSRKDADVATARQVYDAARLYVTSELEGKFTSTSTTGLTITIGPKATASSLQGKGYLEDPLYLPSTKDEIDGGSVTFNTDGSLNQVTITTTATTDPTPFTADEVMSGKPSTTR